jgi:hypothetical protein
LRLASSACLGLAALDLAAFSAATSRIPPRHGAVGRTSATPSALRISKAANLFQLLSSTAARESVQATTSDGRQAARRCRQQPPGEQR